jgi:hypothetical protein
MKILCLLILITISIAYTKLLTDPNDTRTWIDANVGTFALARYKANNATTRQKIIDDKLLDDDIFDITGHTVAQLLHTPWSNADGAGGCRGKSVESTVAGQTTVNYECHQDSLSIFYVANAIDEWWFQTSSNVGDTVFDMLGETAKAVVFVGVDHGPFPAEAIESTIYLSNNASGPWEICTLERVYLEGWKKGILGDGFTYVVTPASAGTTFRYLSIINGGDSAFQHDGDDEINGIIGIKANYAPIIPCTATLSGCNPCNIYPNNGRLQCFDFLTSTNGYVVSGTGKIFVNMTITGDAAGNLQVVKQGVEPKLYFDENYYQNPCVGDGGFGDINFKHNYSFDFGSQRASYMKVRMVDFGDITMNKGYGRVTLTGFDDTGAVVSTSVQNFNVKQGGISIYNYHNDACDVEGGGIRNFVIQATGGKFIKTASFKFEASNDGTTLWVDQVIDQGFAFNQLCAAIAPVGCPPLDSDNDTIIDPVDNCPFNANTNQSDIDGDGIGDVCDPKRGNIEFPICDVQKNNYVDDPTNLDSIKFDKLTTTAKTYTYNDPIPKGQIHNEEVTVTLALNSKTEGKICTVYVQFNKDTAAASPRNTILLGSGSGNFVSKYIGVTTYNCNNITDVCYTVIDGYWYNYNNQPYNLKIAPKSGGVNVLSIWAQDATCDVQVGKVLISTCWTPDPRASDCSISGNCLLGTCRWGYCACWSGAWGRECTTDGRYPSTLVNPKPWQKAILDLDDGTYKDYGLAATSDKDFFAGKWDNHPTCKSSSNFGFTVPLATKSPPVMEFAKFENGKFNIKVSQPMITGRAETVVFINNVTKNPLPDRPWCVYPISNFMTKEVESCKDVFTIRMPWESAQRCYWKVVQEANFEVYKGQIVLRHQEWVLNSIDQWRTIQSVLRVSIKFQKFISVDTTSSVYNEARLVAAITQQIVAIDRKDPARVEIVSVLPWPYKLDAVVNKWNLGLVPKNQDSSNKYSSIEYFSTDCTEVEGKECKQRWNQYFYLNDKTCTLTGQYAINYTLLCGDASTAAAAACPLEDKDKKVAIVYSLTSEDFCATIEIDIGLTSVMNSYEDNTFAVIRTAFVVGRNVYFKIVTSSDVTTVGFQGSKITEVQFLLKSNDVTAAAIQLYKNAVTSQCTSSDCAFQTISRADPKETAFTFAVTQKLIDLSAAAAAGSPALKANSKITFTLSAVVQVNYIDSASGKRAIFGGHGLAADAGASQSGASTAYDFTIDGTQNIAPTSSTGGTTGTKTETSGVSTLIASILLLTVLFFI